MNLKWQINLFCWSNQQPNYPKWLRLRTIDLACSRRFFLLRCLTATRHKITEAQPTFCLRCFTIRRTWMGDGSWRWDASNMNSVKTKRERFRISCYLTCAKFHTWRDSRSIPWFTIPKRFVSETSFRGLLSSFSLFLSSSSFPTWYGETKPSFGCFIYLHAGMSFVHFIWVRSSAHGIFIEITQITPVFQWIKEAARKVLLSLIVVTKENLKSDESTFTLPFW